LYDEKIKLALFQELLSQLSQNRQLSRRFILVPERLEGFGLLEFDSEKCWACTACKVQCPEEALKISETRKKRTIHLDYWKCVACGECVDSCPKEAVEIKRIFDLEAFLKREMLKCVEAEVKSCVRCGKTIAPVPQHIEVKRNVSELAVPPTYLSDISDYCEECRRQISALTLLKTRRKL